MNIDDLFQFDAERFDKLMEELNKKEQDFRDESMKTVKKKRRSNHKLFEQLMEKDLKKKGYIK